MSTHKLSAESLDPRKVQISRQQAAEILGVSLATFTRLRVSDPKCPKGYKYGKYRTSTVTFRLSEIYEYNEYRMSQAERV